MTEETYYVRFKGRTLGPFAESKVREMVRRGQITRVHELSADSVSWRPASEFPELFPQPVPEPEPWPPGGDDDVVDPPGGGIDEPPDDEGPVGPGVVVGEAEWFAHINGSNKGPVRYEDLQNWVRAGVLDGETLLWKEGWEEWEPAKVALPSLIINVGPIIKVGKPAPGGSPVGGSNNNGSSGAGSGSVRSDRSRGTGFAITSLVLGIISFLLCGGCLTGVPAMIFGGLGISAANKGNGDGKGMAIAGLILGIIATLLGLAWAFFYGIAMIAAISSGEL